MTTILPKEPVVTDRVSVILSNAERRNLRRKLRSSVVLVQDALNPRVQFQRFVAVKKAEAVSVADDVAQVAKQNAAVLGIAGLGALLYIARRPIAGLISKVRNRTTSTEKDRTDDE